MSNISIEATFRAERVLVRRVLAARLSRNRSSTAAAALGRSLEPTKEMCADEVSPLARPVERADCVDSNVIVRHLSSRQTLLCEPRFEARFGLLYRSRRHDLDELIVIHATHGRRYFPAACAAASATASSVGDPDRITPRM
jgi:hypothetical protein